MLQEEEDISDIYKENPFNFPFDKIDNFAATLVRNDRNLVSDAVQVGNDEANTNDPQQIKLETQVETIVDIIKPPKENPIKPSVSIDVSCVYLLSI